MEFFSLESMVLFGGFTVIAIVSGLVGFILGIKEEKKREKDEQ